jgi:hypothetical protein
MTELNSEFNNDQHYYKNSEICTLFYIFIYIYIYIHVASKCVPNRFVALT